MRRSGFTTSFVVRASERVARDKTGLESASGPDQGARLAQKIQARLLAILAGDRPDATRLRASLQTLQREGSPACAMAVRHLTGLDLPEPDAERFLNRALLRRGELAAALSRDPGLRVALADLLCRASGSPAVGRLPGRRDLRGALDREIQRCRRTGSGFALLLRRAAGQDDVRRTGSWHGRLRAADEVFDLGEDGFAVVLPETDRLGAHAAGRRVRPVVETAARRAVAGAPAGAAGVAVYPEDAHDPRGLLERASEALREAERTGGGRVCLHHAGRRRWPRYPPGHGTGIWIGIRGQPASARIGALDLGRGGILLRSRVALHRGEPLRIGFSASPGTPASGPEAVCEARVVRAERDRWQAEFFRIGAAFQVPLPERRLRALVNRSGTRVRPRRGEAP